MTTAADFEPELIEALNLLIEDERASVEMEVALASGATEYAERDALSRMGIEDIGACETLRSEMERAGLLVSPQINGVVFEVLGAERYDDRLRAFAHHQRIVAERANDLLDSNLDGALREALENVVGAHDRHVVWASDRAEEFAATRLMEFGPRQLDHVERSAAPADQTESVTPLAPEVSQVPREIAPTDQVNEALPLTEIAVEPAIYDTPEIMSATSAAEPTAAELAEPIGDAGIIDAALPGAPEATEQEAAAPKKRGRPRGSKNSTTAPRAKTARAKTTRASASETTPRKTTSRRKTAPSPAERPTEE